MVTFLCRNQLYWLFCIILLIYCIIPSLSQQDDINCNLPLIETDNEVYIGGCGLFCDSNEAATPWTDRTSNKNISILFLAFLIPAFICNLIFTLNNISEHRENEETFDTTPITYDALFVIDIAYLVVIIFLLIPHFSYFDGGNTVSSTYICNYNEPSLSIGNPTNANNGLCTFFGLLIFTGFKIILIYTGILCINIWYRLWKPMVDVGIKKKWLHGCAFIIVFIFDIFILGFGGIDANPSNGICYLSMDAVGLLLMLDIIPNILFIIISTICVVHATKQLRQEMKVIEKAQLISDDIRNLIHRMNGFLIMAVISAAFIVFTEIIWWSSSALYNESTKEWIHCTQSKVITEYNGTWKYEIGDQCISELKEDGYSFPNEMFFILFPIAALFSNIAIIILTCHRRQSDRWIRGTIYVKNILKTMKTNNCNNCNNCLPKKPETNRITSNISDEPINEQNQESTEKPIVVALKGKSEEVTMSKLPSDPPSDEEEEDEPMPTNKTADVHISTNSKPNLSVKVHHTPENSGDVEKIGSVQHHPNGPDANTMSFENTPTGKSTDTPTGLPSLADDNTMIRHPTPHDDKLMDDKEMDEFQRQLSLQEALENKGESKLSLREQTEMLIKLDKSKSERARDRLEHIANASFDYHNLTQQGKAGVPLPAALGLEKIDSGAIAIDEDDINKSKQLNARLHSLQFSTSNSYSDDNTSRSNGNGNHRDSQRSKTLPSFPKRSSTQRNFLANFDKAVVDLNKKDELKKQHKSKSTKSVKFVNDGATPPLTPQSINTNDEDPEHLINKMAANVILRSATDSLVRRANDNEDVSKQKAKKQRLKKVKTSIDATNAVKLDLNDIDIEDNSSDSLNNEKEPDIGDRRLSHQQRQQQHLQQVTERQKRGFFDKGGQRKKDLKKLSKTKGKNRWGISLKAAKDFVTSSGISMYTPSSAGLLKPVTMESQYNIDTDYFDEETETTYSTQSTFDSLDNELDVLLNGQQQRMQWQSNTNIFHFTLCDDDFKSMLHSTFTPHSTRKCKRMTFDVNDPYAQNDAIIIKEDEETETETVTPMSKLGAMETQSMNDLKCDQSVSGIGSDGKIVLSDINRFKNSRSVPLENEKKDPNMMLSEDEEHEYDIKYDDDELIKKIKPKSKVPKVPKGSHHRTETLHGRLLDAVPHSDRKDLIINIHQDFSCEVVEKGRHFKAETAKLAFTLKPVHSMKILM